MEEDDVDQLEELLGGGAEPTLTKDVIIDSYTDKRQANAMSKVYAKMLTRRGLAGRFGVAVRSLGAWEGWGIYVGPHCN